MTTKQASDKQLDNVLNKLKKLKSLYEGALEINSENEAAAAAAAINRLLLQYNLSMDEIGTDDEKEADKVLHEVTSGFTYKSIGGAWEHSLTTVLCRWNFCRCYIYGRSHKTLMIIGKRENLETVKWLREMLSERFVSFSKDRYKEYKKTREYAMNPIGRDTYQRSYLIGAAEGLDAKLKEEDKLNKAEDEVFGAKITSLVVRNDQAVKEYVEEMFGKAGKRRSSQKYNSAREFGYKDGKNTNLHKQVTSSANSQANGVNLLG